MYKVNGEALLQELKKLETDASEREARNREDAAELALKRGYGAEKTERIKEVLDATDDDFLRAKEKIAYLSAFVEDVPEERTAEVPDTVREAAYGEIKY